MQGKRACSIRALAAVVALVAAVAVPTAASAQEAPICTKERQRLSDRSNDWSGGRRDDSVNGLRGMTA